MNGFLAHGQDKARCALLRCVREDLPCCSIYATALRRSHILPPLCARAARASSLRLWRRSLPIRLLLHRGSMLELNGIRDILDNQFHERAPRHAINGKALLLLPIHEFWKRGEQRAHSLSTQKAPPLEGSGASSKQNIGGDPVLTPQIRTYRPWRGKWQTPPYRSGPSKPWIKIKNPKAPAAMRVIDGTF